jgi:hypothetical protein
MHVYVRFGILRGFRHLLSLGMYLCEEECDSTGSNSAPKLHRVKRGQAPPWATDPSTATLPNLFCLWLCHLKTEVTSHQVTWMPSEAPFTIPFPSLHMFLAYGQLPPTPFQPHKQNTRPRMQGPCGFSLNCFRGPHLTSLPPSWTAPIPPSMRLPAQDLYDEKWSLFANAGYTRKSTLAGMVQKELQQFDPCLRPTGTNQAPHRPHTLSLPSHPCSTHMHGLNLRLGHLTFSHWPFQVQLRSHLFRGFSPDP